MANANGTDDGESDEESIILDLINAAAGKSIGVIEETEAIISFISMLYYITRQVDIEQGTRVGEVGFDAMIVDLIARLESQDYKDFANWDEQQQPKDD